MSHVPVNITWNGPNATAHPDKAIVKLSQGQNQVKWTSPEDFVIHIQSTQINATLTGSQYVANSPAYSTPQKIQYAIARAAGGPAEDPEIEIQT
jgi:hypothetical protein